MKKILLVSSAMLVAFGMVSAQNPTTSQTPATTANTTSTTVKKKSPKELARDKASEMSSVCGLQAEQMDQVSKLYADYYAGVNALGFQKPPLSEDRYKTKVAELKSTRNDGLRAVLSVDQRKMLVQAKYDRDSAPASKAKSDK